MNPKPPVLFVGHGFLMFALEPGAAWGSLDRPWEGTANAAGGACDQPALGDEHSHRSIASQLETIHDYGGFDSRVYELRVLIAKSQWFTAALETK